MSLPASESSFDGGRQRTALATFEWAALIVGLVFALLFLIRNLPLQLSYDDAGYALAGRNILENGLFTNFHQSDVRTYGYPLFLSLAQRVSDFAAVPLRVVVFAFQLVLYFSAALFLRFEIWKRSRFWGRVVFCALVVNFYALLYVSEVLTESHSLSLLIATVGSWLWLQRESRRLAPLLIGSAAAAAAVMIRPANLFLLGSWVIACCIIFMPWRPTRRDAMVAGKRIGIVALVCGAVFLPQLINNARHWQRYTPLVASDLQGKQQRWGIDWLKYATSIPPVKTAQVFYHNPLVAGIAVDNNAPLSWYFNHPRRGILTIALHLFNMTDQDLVFTYARDLHPWYRVPHALLNHAIVALGLLGFVLWWRMILQRRVRTEVKAGAAMTVLVISNCAIYATTVVEMRFGLTVLSILFPCAAFALLSLRKIETRSLKFAAAAFIGAYAIGGLALSNWARSHSPHLGPPGAFDLKLAMIASGQGLTPAPELLPDGAVFAHAPTQLALDVPEGVNQLTVSYGFLPAAWSNGGATTGACFRVSEAAANGVRVLHERCIDPVAVPAERGKIEVSVPLSSSRPARVLFETTGGAGTEYDWTVWQAVAFESALED